MLILRRQKLSYLGEKLMHEIYFQIIPLRVEEKEREQEIASKYGKILIMVEYRW